MAADHVNYEEDMNQQYKTPTALVNLWMRVGWFLFLVPGFMIMFNFDDMIRIFQPHKYSYIGNVSDTVTPSDTKLCTSSIGYPSSDQNHITIYHTIKWKNGKGFMRDKG